MRTLIYSLMVAIVGPVTLTRAADVWVDPVAGDDTAAGTSASVALRTLTEASTRAAAGDTVYVLPGDLGLPTGEAFPLRIPESVRVESTGGALATVVDARDLLVGNTPLIEFERGSAFVGMTVLLSDSGVALGGTPFYEDPVLIKNCVVDGGAGVLRLHEGGFAMEDCAFRDQRGDAVYFSPQAGAVLSLTRCELAGRANGLSILTPVFSSSFFKVDRCVFRGHSGAGVKLVTPSLSGPEFEVTGCLFEGNRVGIESNALIVPSYATWTIEHCTFVENDHYGILMNTNHSLGRGVDSCIFSGNGLRGLRILSLPLFSVTRSLLQESFNGSGAGNLLADAGFVDAGSGDYSLRADSPCVDAGSFTASLPDVDLLGRRRVVDGNLDFTVAPDMGALELSPLVGPFSVNPGSPAIYGVSGQAGGFSTIVVAPNGIVLPGVSTQYGTLFVNGSGAFRLTPVTTTGGGPTLVDIAPFVSPSWSGTTIGLQALTRSSAAPAGGAFTNPIPVLVQ